MRYARLGAVALLAVGCASAPAATPIVIYVTPPPSTVAPPASLSPSAIPAIAPTTAPSPTSTPTAATHTVTVQITLNDPLGGGTILSQGDNGCSGWHADSDIGPGLQATIRDDKNDVLGIANFTGYGKSLAHNGTWTTICQFRASAEGIADAAFYSIDVGSRQPVQFSRDELAANSWNVALSLN
jgi:hypothetical protein